MIAKLFLLLGAHSPKRYVASTFWILFTKILSIGVSLAATFYIARTLGPQNYGELNYALSIVNLLAFFSAIASTTVICRDLVKQPEREQTILGTAFILSMAGTILTVVIVGILLFFLPHEHITFYIVGLLCLAQLCAPFSVAQNIFYANTKTKYISLTQLSVHITVSIAKIVAMTFDQGVIVLATIMLVEQLLLSLIMVTLYTSYTKHYVWHWNVDWSYAKQLAHDSVPFVFISMSILVSGRIDQVFLKHYIDTMSVGFYTVAVQLTEIWQAVPQTLLVALFPAMVNAHRSGYHYARRIVALSGLLLIYSIGVSALTTVLAPYIVPLIYGEAFVASIPLLQIYTWSLLGTVFGFLITNILVTDNQRLIQVVMGVFPMLLNIVLNIILIPRAGAAGAAFATVISYSTAPLIPFCFASIRYKIKTLLRPESAS